MTGRPEDYADSNEKRLAAALAARMGVAIATPADLTHDPVLLGGAFDLSLVASALANLLALEKR